MPTKTVTAKAVSERLRRVLGEHFDGVQANLQRRCGFASRDTVANWFRPKPAMPDLAQLARIADVAGVSLDWLVLGREPMEWPGRKTVDAPAQFYGAVCAHIEEQRAARKAPLPEGMPKDIARTFGGDRVAADQWDDAVLRVLNRWGSQRLWEEAVREVENSDELRLEVEDVIK